MRSTCRSPDTHLNTHPALIHPPQDEGLQQLAHALHQPRVLRGVASRGTWLAGPHARHLDHLLLQRRRALAHAEDGGQQEGKQGVQLQQVVLERCACGVYQGVDEAKDQSDAE